MNMRDLVTLIESQSVHKHLWATVSKDVAQAVTEHGMKGLVREYGSYGRACKMSNDPPPDNGANLDGLMVVLEFKLDPDARILDLRDSEDADVWQNGPYMDLRGTPAFVKVLRHDGIAGVADNAMGDTWMFLRSKLTFVRVYDGIVDEAMVHYDKESLDEVALGGLKRCTAVTLNALLAHYSKPGIMLGEVPETGEQLLQVMLSHGLAYKPEPMVAGKTVQQFVSQHSQGSWYVTTPGHAMALIDGQLYDAENKGEDGRKVLGAVEVTRR